jgi:threonine/homoserine/homoserine lactone efflux protein
MQLAAIAAGFAMGFGGSIAPSGPISLLVLERGLSERYREGLAVAAGATIAEALYCALAVFGLTAVVQRYPIAERAITWLGVATLCAVGLHFLFFRPRSGAVQERATHQAGWPSQLALGFTLAIANPVMILTWSAAMATLLAVTRLHFGAGDRIVFVLAVAAGVFTWFWSMLAGLRRLEGRLTLHGARWLIRGMGALLLGLAAMTAIGGIYPPATAAPLVPSETIH